eukprot:13806006-Alexandrium_andersonii.AAC.1
MAEAGSGTDRPNMRVIKPLRQQIWTQTETAVIDDLGREEPAVVAPAPRTYRLYHEPPLQRALGQPDGHRHVTVRL